MRLDNGINKRSSQCATHNINKSMYNVHTPCVGLNNIYYENRSIVKNLLPKKWKFSDKNSDIFHISAQNIDCGHSLELPWGITHNLCFRAEIRRIKPVAWQDSSSKSRFDLVAQRQIFRPITETKSWSWELMLLIKFLDKYLWPQQVWTESIKW